MRTRFLSRMTNKEVERFLDANNVIFLPVGSVEMHGEFPLDCETVLAEAFALEFAQIANGLVLHNLPYFYAGATTIGKGTVQVGIRQGIDYLSAISDSLLRQGFMRQIYVTAHAPAHLSCSPVVREFFDKTRIPILYIDIMHMLTKTNVLSDSDCFNSMIIGAYDMVGRIEDVPLTNDVDYDFYSVTPPTTAFALPLFDLAPSSGSVGYHFGESTDHLPTPKIESVFQREKFANKGKLLIQETASQIDICNLLNTMNSLHDFEQEVMQKYPWAAL